MNQPKDKEETPDMPVPADEEQLAPVREPEQKPKVEEPEPEEPKRIL